MTYIVLFFIAALPHWAVSRWEDHVERMAIDACQRNGGVPLTAPDGVVSCAPVAVRSVP